MLWWRLERKTTFTFASIATILHFKSWVSRQLLFAGSSWPKAQYSSIQLNTDWFTRRFGLWCLRSNATQRFGSVDAGGQSTLPTWCCIGEFLACKLRCLRLAKFDQKQVVYLSFGSKFEVDGPNPSCSELFSPLCKCKFFPSSKLHYSPCFVDFKAQADGPPWQLQETFHQPQRRAQGHPPGFSKTGNLCLYPKRIWVWWSLWSVTKMSGGEQTSEYHCCIYFSFALLCFID